MATHAQKNVTGLSTTSQFSRVFSVVTFAIVLQQNIEFPSKLVINIYHLLRSQGSCRVLTHLSKKTAKLNRSAVSPERQKAVLPVIPVDEADRRKALYTGIVEIFCMTKISFFSNPPESYCSFFLILCCRVVSLVYEKTKHFRKHFRVRE